MTFGAICCGLQDLDNLLEQSTLEPTRRPSKRADSILSPGRYSVNVGVSERLLELQTKPQIREGELSILCITWNVGNKCPHHQEMASLLQDLDSVDMLVFAAQEAVFSKCKTAKSPVGTTTGVDSGVSDESEDETVLDADFVADIMKQRHDGQSDLFTDIVAQRAAVMGFESVQHIGMGEIRLLVYARKNLLDSGRITRIETDCVPTGVAGVGTNKGGVVMTLYVFTTCLLARVC